VFCEKHDDMRMSNSCSSTRPPENARQICVFIVSIKKGQGTHVSWPFTLLR
jgi:hypothetical protein